MKIRTDFVTNSSSSSFVTLNVNSKTFAKILENYQHLFEDDCWEHLELGEDYANFYIEEGYADVPDSKKQIIVSILSALGCELYWDDYEEENLEDCKLDGYEGREELYKDIVSKSKDIMEDIEYFEMVSGDIGWQGDSESRYYEDNYDEETLQMYYEEIAEEKGCSVDDVTSEDFQEWVSDKVSTEENTYSYDAKTGKEEHSHSFTVE